MPPSSRRRAVTLVEMLVVIGVIVFLVGVLLAALAAVRGSGEMTSSESRLRQIAIWTQSYASDNREFILPSEFDYSDASYKGNVRATVAPDGSEVAPQIGERHVGTWTDILWTVNEVAAFPQAVPDLGHDYRFDSPDAALYALLGEWSDNPFRSAAPNSRNASTGSLPTPFGEGAQEAGAPGYFAANGFFDSTTNGWWVTGQIRSPDRSLYALDSVAGETIECSTEALGEDDIDEFTAQVDFRYNEQCLILFMDGHVAPQTEWVDLADLQDNRRIRVLDLHRRQ